jgi:hypothetical protein
VTAQIYEQRRLLLKSATWVLARKTIFYAMAFLRFVQRVVTAVTGAAMIAGVLRLRGQGGVPPQTGGWRELSGPDHS